MLDPHPCYKGSIYQREVYRLVNNGQTDKDKKCEIKGSVREIGCDGCEKNEGQRKIREKELSSQL